MTQTFLDAAEPTVHPQIQQSTRAGRGATVMTFAQWLDRELLKAYGAFYAPDADGTVRYFADAFDAERARKLYCARQERQREARLVYAYGVAAA